LAAGNAEGDRSARRTESAAPEPAVGGVAPHGAHAGRAYRRNTDEGG